MKVSEVFSRGGGCGGGYGWGHYGHRGYYRYDDYRGYGYGHHGWYGGYHHDGGYYGRGYDRGRGLLGDIL